MTWFSKLATWLNGTSQQIHLDVLRDAVVQTGITKTQRSVRNVRQAIIEVRAIRYELRQLQKEMDYIEQLSRIEQHLNRKRMCEENNTPATDTPETPEVVTDEKVENQEEKNHGTFGKPQ